MIPFGRTVVRFEVPGPPQVWKRAGRRHFIGKDGKPRSSTYTHEKAESWRGAAQYHMLAAMRAAGLLAPLTQALAVVVLAIFPFPQSRALKKGARPRAWHDKAGDKDNVFKLVADSGEGILWVNDKQISIPLPLGIVAAQGERPRTVVEVRVLEDAPPAAFEMEVNA